jgi:hypothetical protein
MVIERTSTMTLREALEKCLSETKDAEVKDHLERVLAQGTDEPNCEGLVEEMELAIYG